MPDQRVVFEHRRREIAVSYRSLRDGRFRFGDGVHARIHAWSPDAIDAEINGRRARARDHAARRPRARAAVRAATSSSRSCRASSCPGSEATAGGFIARMPGKVIDLRVAVGDRVAAGQTLVVLEAMKMEHPMSATEPGVVREVRVAVGDQVESGAVLLVVEPEGRSMMGEPIRIANCSGFFGDRLSAAREMVEGGPIDVLTGDWLAELTMLILARTRMQAARRRLCAHVRHPDGAGDGHLPRPRDQGGHERGRARSRRLRRGGGAGRGEARPPPRDRVRARRRPPAAHGRADQPRTSSPISRPASRSRMPPRS